MNHKQKRKIEKRRRHPHRHIRKPSSIELAYAEVKAKAKLQKKGSTYVELKMRKLGYLPNGNGGWREMTTSEREMWDY